MNPAAFRGEHKIPRLPFGTRLAVQASAGDPPDRTAAPCRIALANTPACGCGAGDRTTGWSSSTSSCPVACGSPRSSFPLKARRVMPFWAVRFLNSTCRLSQYTCPAKPRKGKGKHRMRKRALLQIDQRAELPFLTPSRTGRRETSNPAWRRFQNPAGCSGAAGGAASGTGEGNAGIGQGRHAGVFRLGKGNAGLLQLRAHLGELLAKFRRGSRRQLQKLAAAFDVRKLPVHRPFVGIDIPIARGGPCRRRC